jgi:formamidopyrimidine-DNA glycosylase
MPELPEVETIRRQLDSKLTGRTLQRVSIEDPRLTRPEAPGRVEASLQGRRIDGVARRGKFLRFTLDHEEELVLHLRMTGRLHVEPTPPAGSPHVRAVFHFDESDALVFRDQRRFGTLRIADLSDPPAEWDSRLGVEPLGSRFTATRLGELLDGRMTSIKAALLDQRLVAGIGNIYADEALFAARIDPRRPAGALSGAEIRALHRAIRDRLRAGIRANGASIDSFHDSLGNPGTMQEELRVHLREGQACPRCRAPITKLRVAQRGTYICERCQR